MSAPSALMRRLQNKTAFVTGAASGIGLAITKAFLEHGAHVIAADLNGKQLEQEMAPLQAQGHALTAVRCDVTDVESVAAAVRQAQASGVAVNTLVNCAGIIHVGTILETSVEDLRRVWQVNVEGTFIVTKAWLPHMIESGGGVIVNMASLSSLTAMHERFAYSTSKAAVMMMTRSVALDFVKKGIRANCICPARVHTELVDNYLKNAYAGREAETFRKFSEYQPIGRMIRPDEVASMAVYLASEESAMVTGSSFPIDGGVLAGV